MFDCKGWTPIKSSSVLTSFYYKGVAPSNGIFIFNLFFKRVSIKHCNLANFKFPKIEKGPLFGVRLVIGGRD